MKTKGINYLDLLHAPYRAGGRSVDGGIDCWGLAIEVLERARIADRAEIERSISLTVPGERWLKVGDRAWQASRVGDVIYSTPSPGSHHVTVVACEQPAVLLTTAERHGVVTTRAVLIEGVQAVYRWNPDA